MLPHFHLLTRRVELAQMLCRMKFPADVAEEASQQALIRAMHWSESGRLQEIRNHEAWLRKVAIRAALTVLGRQNARRKRFHPYLYEPVVSPFEEMERKEEVLCQVEAIMAALSRLPVKLRAVFTYCKVEGHTIKQTATAFGLPVGTVNGRLVRARRAIRRQLGFDPLPTSFE